MLPLLDVNMALVKGDFELLRNLLESGADLNIRDKEGRTALINCCLHDGEKWASGSARLLLTYGAKVGLCDKAGRNALMYAIMYERESLVKLFLDALDYDLNHTDKLCHKVLWYASRSRNINITTMVRDISKKYCLNTETSEKTIPFHVADHCMTLQKHKANTNNHAKNTLGATINRTQYPLPYKTLPASLWEKREKFYSNQKNLTGSSSQRFTSYLPALQRTTKLSILPMKKKIQEHSTDYTWREDKQILNAMLEVQLSSSYYTKANLLPPSIKRYPKIPKTERENMKNEAQARRRGRNRRLSFDGLNVLQNITSAKGLFRRRCSVAVIPLIRFQNYKSSVSKDQEYQKSLLSTSVHG